MQNYYTELSHKVKNKLEFPQMKFQMRKNRNVKIALTGARTEKGAKSSGRSGCNDFSFPFP